MLPEPDQHQRRREFGWWDAHERNCIGCHSFDGYGGAIAETIEDEAMHPPMLVGQGSKVHPSWLFSFLKEPTTIRPWLEVRMPTFELSDSQATDLVKFFAGLDEREFKFETLTQEATAAEMAQGRALFGELKCQSCHVLGDQFPQGKPPSEWAPDLSMATARLQPDWIDEWLKDPQELLPGTKMPNFFYYFDEDDGYVELYPDAGKDIFKVREHVMSLGRPRGGAGHGASP
jgi:mono/diheme cytochrome c family protein